MMSSRRRRSWKLKPLPGGLEKLAREVFERHSWLIDEGYVLTEGQSGVWRRKDGRITIRLVYRRGDGSWVFSGRFEVSP